MAKTSIEWADYTFNPWWGCTKVSEACRHCYAEALARRWGTGWGPESDRRFFGDKHWNDPLRWDRKAAKDGLRRRVFCASMADVFEDRPELIDHRKRLWHLIEATPNLIWMLLTKRPENIASFAPMEWMTNPPANVWYGTTVEEQKWMISRVNALMRVPASVRFLSCEPLLSPLDLGLFGTRPKHWRFGHSPVRDALHWVIVGGESGPGARPMQKEWVISLHDQCVEAGVAFFFKQWGEHSWRGVRIGKKRTGRLLDGDLHNAVPDYEGKEIEK